MTGIGIGELARRTDVKVANIRFYEESGLSPLAARREGGHRQYGSEDVRRLMFIRSCRELGFSLDQVKALLKLAQPDNLQCTEAQELSRTQLTVVRKRIANLQVIETQLVAHLNECSAACCSARVPSCSLLPSIS